MRLFTLNVLGLAAFAGFLAGCSGSTAATPKAAGPDATALGTSKIHPLESGTKVALEISGGYYVTAVDGGGGPKQPNCGKFQLDLHENAKSIGSWETFTLVPEGGNSYAFEIGKGPYYITAVGGGGFGAPNGDRHYSRLHTNAKTVGAWEKFTIVYPNPSQPNEVAIQTPDGIHYVTAADGGGCGGNNDVPFHTNAQQVGPWETFTLVPEN